MTQAGLLATATLLAIGVSSVAGGYVADNFGRKKALLASLLTFGAFTAVLAVVPNFPVFLVLRFLVGIGLGAVWSVVSAYVVETWPSRSRGRAAAFVISAFPAGGALAAVISGQFLPDWRLMFLIAGAAVVLPVGIVLVSFPESASWAADKAEHAASVSVRDVLSGSLRRTTLLGTLMAALALTGYLGATTWLPTYLTTERDLPAGSVAVLMTILNLGMFVGYNGFGMTADQIGRHRTIILTLLGVTLTGAGFCFNVGRGVSAFAPFALAGLAGTIGFSGGLIVCAGFFALAVVVAPLLPRTGVHTADPAVGSNVSRAVS